MKRRKKDPAARALRWAFTFFVFIILAVTLTTLDRERAFDRFQEREILLDENNMFL